MDCDPAAAGINARHTHRNPAVHPGWLLIPLPPKTMKRLYVCTIEVDEEVFSDDFAYVAAAIESAVDTWEGCKVVRWDTEDD